MPSFQISIDIDKPVQDVFAYTSQIENRMKWQPSLQKVVAKSEGPMCQGTKWLETTKIGTRTEDFEMLYKTFEPNKRILEDVKGRIMTGKIDILFEDQGAKTRLIVIFNAQFKGLLKLVSPLVIPVIKRGITEDVTLLKGLIEAQS